VRYAPLVIGLLAVGCGCTRKTPVPSGSAAPTASSAEVPVAPSQSVASPPSARVLPAQPVRRITALFTSDEHGWVLPHGGKGGALVLLQHWLKNEGYCLASEPGACDPAETFALSAGDNWTGPALSSYFAGKPMAETMHALGYAATALGNHELDFGQQTLIDNAAIQGPFLSANLLQAEGRTPLPVHPFVVIERNAVRIGIVGLTTRSTPTFLLPSCSEGLTFEDEEQTLARVVPEVWKAGADVVIVLAHVCPDLMKQIVVSHPDWNLAFVGAGHCHSLKSLMAGKVPVLEPAAELTWYARVRMTVDLSRPQQERLTHVDPLLVELGALPPPSLWADPVRELHTRTQEWKARTDEALGEVVGYSAGGMTRASMAMVHWILGAWRKQTGADVAFMSKYDLRQNLPPGEVRARDLWDILPNNNKLVTMRLTGQDLTANAECCKALLDGMKRVNGTWVLSSGRKVEPAATYLLVAPDDAFSGGGGFSLREHASDVQFGADWREPVVQWSKEHKTTPGTPLELLVFR
jgi:5'-nucleotidase / UDP-sugar diphosphatase